MGRGVGGGGVCADGMWALLFSLTLRSVGESQEKPTAPGLRKVLDPGLGSTEGPAGAQCEAVLKGPHGDSPKEGDGFHHQWIARNRGCRKGEQVSSMRRKLQVRECPLWG